VHYCELWILWWCDLWWMTLPLRKKSPNWLVKLNWGLGQKLTIKNHQKGRGKVQEIQYFNVGWNEQISVLYLYSIEMFFLYCYLLSASSNMDWPVLNLKFCGCRPTSLLFVWRMKDWKTKIENANLIENHLHMNIPSK
jgi:hypothetical protein